METWTLYGRMFGLPVLAALMVVGCLTPRYVPSDALASAAASTASPDLARQRMAASFGRKCRQDWDLDRLARSEATTLYSWESDAGLLARTRINCPDGRRCSVGARALFAWPFPSHARGKRMPTRIWGCGGVPPDWSRHGPD